MILLEFLPLPFFMPHATEGLQYSNGQQKSKEILNPQKRSKAAKCTNALDVKKSWKLESTGAAENPAEKVYWGKGLTGADWLLETTSIFQ